MKQVLPPALTRASLLVFFFCPVMTRLLCVVLSVIPTTSGNRKHRSLAKRNGERYLSSVDGVVVKNTSIYNFRSCGIKIQYFVTNCVLFHNCITSSGGEGIGECSFRCRRWLISACFLPIQSLFSGHPTIAHRLYRLHSQSTYIFVHAHKNVHHFSPMN